MVIRLHKNARTTPAIRREIQTSTLPIRELAERYGLTRQTVAKWRRRSSTEDASHRPHRLHTRLTPAQEAVVVEWRRLLLLPLDDLLAVTHEFISTAVSRSGLDRCLRRHGVSNLQALRPLPIDPDARPVLRSGLCSQYHRTSPHPATHPIDQWDDRALQRADFRGLDHHPFRLRRGAGPGYRALCPGLQSTHSAESPRPHRPHPGTQGLAPKTP